MSWRNRLRAPRDEQARAFRGDLESIATLGFRGEGLAAIAAVARGAFDLAHAA